MQTIAGISLLISGYYEVSNGLLTYHWRFIGRLAWFSTVTHLAVASCLRRYFYRYTYIRLVRMFFMLCLITMLLTATIPFSNIPDSGFNVRQRAFCLYHPPSGSRHIGYVNREPIFAAAFMCLSLLLRLYKMFNRPAKFFSYLGGKYAGKILRFLINGVTYVQTNSRRWNVLVQMLILQPMVSVIILFDTYLYFLSSKFFEVPIAFFKPEGPDNNQVPDLHRSVCCSVRNNAAIPRVEIHLAIQERRRQ